MPWKFIFVSLGTMFLGLICFDWTQTNPSSPFGWEKVRIPFMDKHTVLVFERKTAHYLFAEYHRRLRIIHRRPGKNQVAERVFKLPINSGGQTKIDVFWNRQDQVYYFLEPGRDHALDLKENCVRTSHKDPGLDIPLCDSPWLDREEFSPSDQEYIGKILQEGTVFHLVLGTYRP